MTEEERKKLQTDAIRLKAEHRAIDQQIRLLEQDSDADQMLILRLKKKKLSIKDEIAYIENRLMPDIIA